jgi:hypothetical protein
MKEALTSLLDNLGQAHWVEVMTETPRCIYYFGPFLSPKEAHGAKQAYWDDLNNEGAQGIQMTVKRCKPSRLTIDDSETELHIRRPQFG